MTLETYQQMKQLVQEYEQQLDSKVEIIQQPYFKTFKVEMGYNYNPNYGDDRICKCGHSYYRHFDSYENMDAVGCKYCGCFNFEELNEEDKVDFSVITEDWFKHIFDEIYNNETINSIEITNRIDELFIRFKLNNGSFNLINISINGKVSTHMSDILLVYNENELKELIVKQLKTK